jgi:hypothetical protein
MDAPFGFSQKTVMSRLSRSMSATILVTDTQTGAGEAKWSDRERSSPCEPMAATRDLFGDGFSTTADKKASTVRSSETKAHSYRPSLSDRLTRSLITSGLVAGITPMSVRKTLGLAIRDFASLPLAGVHAGTQRAACEFSNGSSTASLSTNASDTAE